MASIELILYYLVLADSIIANILAWCCKNWYQKNYKKWAKRFPLTKFWCALYLALTLWLGSALFRLGII